MDCVNDLTKRFNKECKDTITGKANIDKCQCDKKDIAAQECAQAACMDARNGVVEDGRVKIILP